ncbi:hypothetical protein ACA910_000801 [Epithemia clementina (nom. ined.)]
MKFSIFLLTFALALVDGFTIRSTSRSVLASLLNDGNEKSSCPELHRHSMHTRLFLSNDPTPSISSSDQQILGISGTISGLIVFISEYTLASTGCGLPAGPFGIFGLAEGISYLGVVGIAGYSAFTKIKTGSGLPAGPGGLLGAAEGLSFLAIFAGLVVLALQITNYGYIPNAVPMDGGMCS